MKVKILLSALFVALIVQVNAQEKKEKIAPNPEQKVECRVKQMQKELLLDDATAAKFAPLYKEYLLAMFECMPKCKMQQAQPDELTDKQIIERIETRMAARQKCLDVEKKYYKKLSSILNAKQLLRVFCDGRTSFMFPRGTFKGNDMRGHCPRRGMFMQPKPCGDFKKMDRDKRECRANSVCQGVDKK